MSPKGRASQSQRRMKARDRAVRKIEEKEAEQDKKTGQRGKPVRSIGRTMRENEIGNA